MVAYTQSGLSVIGAYGPPELTPNPTVPGTNVKILGGIRAGDCTTVFLYLCYRFHTEVEALNQGDTLDDWGYTLKQITGGSGWSNHAGGAAVDLNSLQHGQSRKGTFTVDELHAIANILNDLVVIEWGGSWGGSTVDEMHFQVRAKALALLATTAAAIKAGKLPNVPAELLGAGVAPKPPSTTPPATQTPTAPEEEDDMAYTPEQLKKIVQAAASEATPGIYMVIHQGQQWAVYPAAKKVVLVKADLGDFVRTQQAMGFSLFNWPYGTGKNADGTPNKQVVPDINIFGMEVIR